MIRIDSNGGQIYSLCWINGDLSSCKRFLPIRLRFGSFWWGEKSEQPEITPAPTGWTPAELPDLICWYNADDGLYVDSTTGQQFLRDLSENGGRMIVGDGLTVSKVNGNTVFNKEEA